MEQIIPIYSGVFEDFHWAGFGSGSGTNLCECAKVIMPSLIFSNKLNAKLFSHEVFSKDSGVDCEAISSSGYQGRRQEYDSLVLEMLHRHEDKKGHSIDLIVLGGYMRIVSKVLLDAYPDKIINIHPADLSILADGKRKYVGGDAVYDAIKAGEPSTRSSVIMVDGGIDHGEMLVQGRECFVDTNYSVSLREYVDGTANRKGHQEIQKEISDWPALTKTLELIAQGRLALGTEKRHYGEWRGVYLDGKLLSYGGLELG
jgi:phosphoribosylglycinamide formyltransferase 1